jgi:hypothetical protein
MNLMRYITLVLVLSLGLAQGGFAQTYAITEETGISGGPVAGTIEVEDEDIAVPNGPHSVFNFTGDGVDAIDAGGGQVDITIPGQTSLANVAEPLAFRARKPSVQVISASGAADVVANYDAEDYDDEDVFNSTTGTFTAPRAGLWAFTGAIGIDNAINQPQQLEVMIYQNGGSVCRQVMANSTSESDPGMDITCTLDLAETDTVQLVWRAFHTGSFPNIQADTYFEGHEVAGGIAQELEGKTFIPTESAPQPFLASVALPGAPGAIAPGGGYPFSIDFAAATGSPLPAGATHALVTISSAVTNGTAGLVSLNFYADDVDVSVGGNRDSANARYSPDVGAGQTNSQYRTFVTPINQSTSTLYLYAEQDAGGGVGTVTADVFINGYYIDDYIEVTGAISGNDTFDVDFDNPPGGAVAVTPPANATHVQVNVLLDADASSGQGNFILYGNSYGLAGTNNSLQITEVSINTAVESNATNTGSKVLALNVPADPAGDLSFLVVRSGTLVSTNNRYQVHVEGWYVDDSAVSLGGTPILEDEGTPVAGDPHSTYNYVGAQVAVTDAGGGEATITILDDVYAPRILNTTAETANFTASIGEAHLVDLSGGNITVDLPPVATQAGQIRLIVSGTGGQLTIDPNLAEQVNGKNTIHVRSGTTTLSNDGTQWRTIQRTARTPTRLDPAQITADQNPYNPTDWDESITHLYIDSDATRTLSGFAEAGFVEMDQVVVVNDGAFDIVIAHDASTTASDRVLVDGSADFTLAPNKAGLLLRDDTANRWRFIAMADPGLSITGTDNQVVRMDGTGAIQNSGVTIDDTNNMVLPGTLTLGNNGTSASMFFDISRTLRSSGRTTSRDTGQGGSVSTTTATSSSSSTAATTGSVTPASW